MKKLYEETHIQDIATAIREKNGATDTYKPSEMAEAIMNIVTGGSGGLEDMIAGNPIDLYSEAESVEKNAFSYNPSIVSVTMPNCNTFGYECFAYCPNLEQVSLSKATKIDNRAFRGCSKLSVINAPMVTEIGSNTLQNSGLLQIPSAENITGILTYGFANCSITEANLPSLTELEAHAFNGCKQLVEVNIGEGLKRIPHNVFLNCSVLEIVILRSPDLITLQNINAFDNTLIESGNGYIYVPVTLVDSYKSETNWSTYANQIRAIEAYPEICGEVTI